jgi:hypothetical protein
MRTPSARRSATKAIDLAMAIITFALQHPRPSLRGSAEHPAQVAEDLIEMGSPPD